MSMFSPVSCYMVEFFSNSCVCVCVCEREREREREKMVCALLFFPNNITLNISPFLTH